MSLAPSRPPESLIRGQTVAEVMHRGVLTLSPSATLREVAAVFAEQRIHCVVIIDAGPPGADDDRLWGVVTSVDLMRGLGSTMPLDAGNLATLDVITVAPDEPLRRAAALMAKRRVSHLVVVSGGRPVGVLSALDIASAAAGASAA